MPLISKTIIMRHLKLKNLLPLVLSRDQMRMRTGSHAVNDYLQDRSFASDMHVIFIYTAHVTKEQDFLPVTRQFYITCPKVLMQFNILM